MSTLSELVRASDYQAARQHVFPSQHSFDWFLRRNRGALVQSGALLFVAGQWHADPAKFDAAVLKIGAELALQRTKAST